MDDFNRLFPDAAADAFRHFFPSAAADASNGTTPLVPSMELLDEAMTCANRYYMEARELLKRRDRSEIGPEIEAQFEKLPLLMAAIKQCIETYYPGISMWSDTYVNQEFEDWLVFQDICDQHHYEDPSYQRAMELPQELRPDEDIDRDI